MKKTCVALFMVVILAAATAVFAADSGATASVRESATATAVAVSATSPQAFAQYICDSASSDPKRLARLFSVEFSVRASIPKDMLDQMGITVEEAVKKSEDEIMKGADEQEGPASCSVESVGETECKALYLKMEKSGFFGMPVMAKNILEAATVMKIDTCAEAKITARGKDQEKEETISFGIGKVAGEWRILTLFLDKEAPAPTAPSAE